MAKVLVNNIKNVRALFDKVNIYSKYNHFKSIMTSEFRAVEAVDELKNNPYYNKYSKKISALQQSLPEEFLSRLEVNVKKNKPNQSSQDDKLSSNIQPAKPGNLKPYNNALQKPKKLNDILKTDLIKDKNKDEISEIWLQYHKTKDAIAATIPNQTYDSIMSRGSKYPVFILPLPRKQGYEFIVCQFNGNEVHFTPLIAYQTHKENAPECLAMIYYPDLKDEKNMILMKGEFDKNVVNPMEAQCLANQLQLFYGEEDEKRTKMLERFTHEPNNFKHMDLIAEFECLKF
ncbi:ATP synthase mitochondrial F1 complex assembly factor 1 [Lycorma delicatula]|uniref:ATP synthase mitochondrial F1 complex assembly factor 1 n=1 Tax=Lycorma delicatula TaxID=130591 RepID=UPI003F50E590